MTKFAIVGAGSIGCYVGGVLAANGADVSFFGRERLAKEINHHGLRITDVDGASFSIKPENVKYLTDLAGLGEADVVLLCTKSKDTKKACEDIASFIKGEAFIVSLQNGIGNADVIRSVLPDHNVMGGMVPYNVVHMGEGHFHRGTSGALVLEKKVASVHIMAEMISRQLDCKVSDNIEGVLWGKLLINTNNAINVISNKPLKEQLYDINYRRCWAMCMREGLLILKEAGITPVKSGDLNPKLFVKVAGFPNWILLGLAKGMRKIDDKARSSMWEDMQAGRESEVDFINGEIVRLAESLNKTAPINKFVCELVRQSFENGVSPAIQGKDLIVQLNKANSAYG